MLAAPKILNSQAEVGSSPDSPPAFFLFVERWRRGIKCSVRIRAIRFYWAWPRHTFGLRDFWKA